MNFFAEQAKARTNTGRLVALFLLAVASLIVITLVFLVFVLTFYTHRPLAYQLHNTKLVFDVSAAIIGVVSIAWLYKSIQLASGGRAVAESMDGTLIAHNTTDIHERKILNVVEEMAIASGIPVPPVYVLEEQGINAFSAGYSIRDAVIAISRGCIVNLSRDELQGVIAHEFSHVFNGDMRLNIRLISTLYGILIIGLIGEFLMRASANSPGRYSSRNSREGVDGIFFTGLGLMVIGYTGSFFGQLIKSAVSRQREFLADASAVQFTRNPEGIGNALKKIGGYPLGSFMDDAYAHEISHLFFNEAVSNRFAGWMATHPPLPERIRRIDRRWNGEFIKVNVPESEKINSTLLHPDTDGFLTNPDILRKPTETLSPIEFVAASAAIVSAATALDQVGTVTPQHVAQTQATMQDIPEQLKSFARNPDKVQVLVYGFLLEKVRPEILEKQLKYLAGKLSASVYPDVVFIKDMVNTLPPKHRLPLMNIAVNTLRQLNKQQYAEFKSHVVVLIQADNVVDLMEWSLYRMLEHFLETKPSLAIGSDTLDTVREEARRLLSAIALTASEDAQEQSACFERGWKQLGLAPATFISDALLHIPQLDQALVKLNRLHPLKKPLFIKACCAALPLDEDPEGIEVIFTIVNSLDVPMPPLLANQKLF